MSFIHPPCRLALVASPERRRAARACLFWSAADARHDSRSAPVSRKTCKRRRELVVGVGADPIDGLGASFVLTMIPSNFGAVTAVSSMACCPRAVWVRHPGLVGSTLVRNECVCVCVWVPGCQLCFFLSAAAIISLGLLPSSPGSRAVTSVAPFRWKHDRRRWWLFCRSTQLPAVLLM